MKKEQENAVAGLLERAKDLVNTMSETSSDMRVIKRNGMEVPFEPSRIIHAVSEANSCITDDNEGLSEMEILSITDNVIKQMRELNHTPNVEEIQNTVVHEIMKKGAYDVAELYIVYRYRRALARKANSTDDRILSLVDFDNEEVKQENSNKNPQIASTQRDYMAGEVSRDITKRLLLPDDIVEAHENGLIHFHDGDYFAQKMYNCFNKHTKFVTSEGVKEFADFKDGETVTVLDKDGKWRKATVRMYGKEPMQKVSMHSARSKAEFVCTKNHRWILHDGTVTTDLKCGDKLYGLVSKCTTADMIETKEQAIAFCIGFSLGDGMECYQSKNKNNYVKVRLCGKKKGYAKYFELAGWHTGPITHPDSLEGDVLAMKKNAFKQSFLTLCGWRYMSLEGKQFLFAGYLAADGSFTTEWQASTADERVSMMIDEISALAGYHVSLKKEITHDTNYKNNARLINYTFRTQQPNNKLWCIDEIKSYRSGELKEAWCVEEPVTHSFTLEHGVVTGNCALMNLKDTLCNGTVITETMIESPKSFLTACNIATQLIAQTASNQYGGQTFSLAHLAPFVEVARNKWRKRLAADNEEQKLGMTDDQMEELVETRVKEEIKSGIQLIQYQLLTLMTTNGQTPFVSMFLYLGEAENRREEKDLAMLIEEVLVQRMEGIKNEKGVYVTPAFPKLLYVLDENNTSEDSEYWYLTELAAKCTAKRMVPDYISAKVMKKLKGDVYPCMGCVDGKSVIDYRFKGQVYSESFEQAWERLSSEYEVKTQPNGRDHYMDTPDVEIYDCKEKEYVKQHRMIRNTQNEWYKVTFTGGKCVDVTSNHPFEIIGRGVVLAEKLLTEDTTYSNGGICSVESKEPYTELKFSYDVTTESEHFTVNGIYSHNCRSFLTPDRFTDAGAGNISKAMDYDGKHKYYGRFNQGVVTLNLVDVACSSGGDMDRFWEILDERLELCHRALKLRHERLEGTPSDIAPVLFQHGVIARLKKGEKIDPLLHDGYSTISLGYAGLNETCMRMCHKSHTDPEAKPFAIAVMRALNDACAKWKEAENVDYSVYGTPLESTTYKFAKCLQKRFGIIKGVTDKNYITNSYHVHVTEEINAFDKLKFEAEFQELSPGGAISYVEVPNMQDNIPAVLSVIKYIYDNIMYAELNTKSDYCQACGYNGEIQIIEDEAGKLIWECPNCRNRDQNTMNVARRTCGYIGTQFWNQGRTQEIKDRVLHL